LAHLSFAEEEEEVGEEKPKPKKTN